MILIILSILIIIVGLIIYFFGNFVLDYGYNFYGTIITVVGVAILGLLTGRIIYKPIEYTNFTAKYYNIQYIGTDKEEIIYSINEKILKCRAYEKSKWVGIYQNKKICELNLLSKGE